MELAYDVVENEDNYMDLPSEFEIHEYKMMDNFCYTIKDSKAQDILLHAIRGKGAFRRFKDQAFELELEKSQVVNLRKRESEFLGFTIRANKKRKKRVAHTGIKADKKRKIKKEAKKHIRRMKASPSALNALLFNSFVSGIHHYFKRATHVNPEFSRLAYDLQAFLYNRLQQVGKYEHPANPPPVYKRMYSLGFKTFKIANVYLFPLGNVKTTHTLGFSQKLTLYTKEGKEYTKSFVVISKGRLVY